jgi:hypothetical protein
MVPFAPAANSALVSRRRQKALELLPASLSLHGWERVVRREARTDNSARAGLEKARKARGKEGGGRKASRKEGVKKTTHGRVRCLAKNVLLDA